MKQRNIITALDIGTSHVRAVVGEPRSDGTVNIIGVGICPSEGLKKGGVVDIDKTVDSITKSMEEAERMAGVEIGSVYASLVGLHVELYRNKGVATMNTEDREIRLPDVNRALEQARVIPMPSEREVVSVIPLDFNVDGYDGIRDPVGMMGVRLEVDAIVVTTKTTARQNLLRCIQKAGIEASGMVLQSFANGEVLLSRDEKELGVFIIDIGGGTTEIAFFQQGIMQNIKVLPVGGDHITKDLAYGLRTSYYAAENLKVEYGCALPSLASAEESIDIITVGGKEKIKVSEKDIAGYIGPRVQEILQFAREEMIKLGGPSGAAAGVVLTGGVSLMEGLTDMAEKIFDVPVRVGEPQIMGVQSPIFTTAVGVVHYAFKNYGAGTAVEKKETQVQNEGDNFFSRIWKRIVAFFNDFFE